MSDSDSSDEELSNEPENIRIGKVLWKIGDCVYSTGDESLMMPSKKQKWSKLLGTLGGPPALKESFWGRKRRIRIQWTNISGKPVSEHGCQHNMLKN